MATFTFTFPAAAAGLPVTVTNRAGETVSTGTLGAADPDFVTYTVDLTWGDSYEATAQAAGSNNYHRTSGERTGSGGVNLANDPALFQCSTLNIGPYGGVNVPFTTLPTGVTEVSEGSATFTGVGAGLYLVEIELDFNDPSDERHLIVSVPSQKTYHPWQGPFIIKPGFGSGAAANLVFTQMVTILGDDTDFYLSINSCAADNAVDPTDLVLTSVSAALNKIA